MRTERKKRGEDRDVYLPITRDPTFQNGSVLRLKSGGPPMTVVETRFLPTDKLDRFGVVIERLPPEEWLESVTCVWFVNGEPWRDDFPPYVLEKHK